MLMEMLFDGFADETNRKYKDSEGMYLDVCDWPYITCDDAERVIKIEISSQNTGGSLELCYVPPKVKLLRITPWGKTELKGSLDLTRLPDGMEALSLHGNQLTEEIDLTRLPEGMLSLFLNENQLTGEVDLTQLPSRMECLAINTNQLTGEIDLTQLPDGMERLYLQKNQFSGKVDLTYLPGKMTLLSLENNHLSGFFVIKTLANGMVINAQQNLFNDIAVVDSKVRAIIKLRGSGVTSVVDENGVKQIVKRFMT